MQAVFIIRSRVVLRFHLRSTTYLVHDICTQLQASSVVLIHISEFVSCGKRSTETNPCISVIHWSPAQLLEECARTTIEKDRGMIGLPWFHMVPCWQKNTSSMVIVTDVLSTYVLLLQVRSKSIMFRLFRVLGGC